MSNKASTSKTKVEDPSSDVEILSGSESESDSGSDNVAAESTKGKGKQGASHKSCCTSSLEGLTQPYTSLAVAPPRVDKKKVKRPASDEDDTEESEDEEPATKKPKSTKKTTGRTSVTVGGLSAFYDMPLEIIAEICSHLNGTDIVRLSLSSRPIRALLLSPSSKTIWIIARRASGLPDLTSDNMNEIEYAQLAFLTNCQGCDNAKVPQADYFLRKRLCKTCRKAEWVKNPHYSAHYHRETRLCVALTPATAANFHAYGTNYRYASKADAEFVSKRLFELEAEDKAIDLENAPPPQAPSPFFNVFVPKVAPDPNLVKSSLLADYIEARKVLVAKMTVDGQAMHSAVVNLEATARVAKSEEKSKSEALGHQRRRAIETKVRALGWDHRDFTGTWKTSIYVNKAELLDDTIWENIKAPVLKLLEKSKATRLVAEAATRATYRQDRLRAPYYMLRCSDSSILVFNDFVHLPSVRPFWEAVGSVFDEAQWNAALPAVLIDIESQRASTRVNAIKLILAATTNQRLSNDPAAYPEATFSDAFFAAPTSFLFCTLPGCRHKPKRRMYYYGSGGSAPRNIFFGPFTALIDHQRQVHPYADISSLSNGHFELPQFMADTIDTLAESIGVDSQRLTTADLDSAWYVWSNSPSKSTKYWNWPELIDEIYHKLSNLRGNMELPVVQIQARKKAPPALSQAL
ncbi:hypothetical protein P7C70_g6675, partial [Phenoliferia sp. Uapishka_3]